MGKRRKKEVGDSGALKEEGEAQMGWESVKFF